MRRSERGPCDNHLGNPKAVYASPEETQAHIDRLQAMENASTRRPYVAYRPERCDGWHVGRSTPPEANQ